MMAVMTAQPPLPLAPDGASTEIGDVVALVEDADGGRVFLRGELTWAWDAGDTAMRCLAAVQLWRVRAARLSEIAAGFGVDPSTVRRWGYEVRDVGVGGLVPAKPGPKGPSKLTPGLVADIVSRRAARQSLARIAAATGVSTATVRRALDAQAGAGRGDADDTGTGIDADGSDADTDVDAGTDSEGDLFGSDDPRATGADDAGADDVDGVGVGGGDTVDAGVGGVLDVAGGAPSSASVEEDPVVGQAVPPVPGGGGAGVVVPVLPGPVDRSGERAAARWGLLDHAQPVFAPAGRVPLVGLFTMFPALAATGLLDCAHAVFCGDAGLPGGFYGLDTMLIEGVARALLGEARAEGATRVDPVALGRVLGLDRAPEVKTIRRRIRLLASTGRAEDWLKALAAHTLARQADPDAGLVLFVDGHVRAYTGTKNIAKTHSPRLKFPAPATVETWVADADGDPVLVVMAEPAASLAGELRRLLPELRAAVGDDRRVLVGFDRGGWSPALFQFMHAHGFDVLTWCKGPVDDLPQAAFTDVTHLDHNGVPRQWRLADTQVNLPLADTGPRARESFTMRQVTRIRDDGRQIHLLTTRHDLPPGEVVWRMGTRWRQENHFRYGRIRFDLDSHDTYAATDDDPDRLVPNPAKKTSQKKVNAAKARLDRVAAATDAALLALHTPPAGANQVRITNTDHDAATADLRAAQAALAAAQTVHKATPARVPLSQVNPGQLVLDTQTKLIHHAIRMAAFTTMTTLARAVRTDTGYAKARNQAHALVRALLHTSGDIIPGDGALTIRLDPLPTARETAAMAELLHALTATQTTYPGTDLTLRYQAKTTA